MWTIFYESGSIKRSNGGAFAVGRQGRGTKRHFAVAIKKIAGGAVDSRTLIETKCRSTMVVQNQGGHDWGWGGGLGLVGLVGLVGLECDVRGGVATRLQSDRR
jgi:hypothetical protein